MDKPLEKLICLSWTIMVKLYRLNVVLWRRFLKIKPIRSIKLAYRLAPNAAVPVFLSLGRQFVVQYKCLG